MTTKPTPSAAAPLDQVEIFRPGRHVAMSGQVIEFSAADVAAIAAAYDPAVHEAPHVVGHPRTDGPAYGWVAGLGVNAAGRLCVTASSQVEPAFAELVTAGRFKKRSASFYPPDHPANPAPGGWYLKHVGWLGATPPAIKGLADVASYAAPEAGLVEFGDWDDELNAGLWRRMREWFIGQFGADTADKVLPAYEVDALQREAMRPESDATPVSPTTAYAEGAPAVTATTQAQLDAQKAELDARAARLAEAEAAQAALQRSARQAGIAAFCDSMIAQGRLLPAERARIASFMESMPDAVRVIEFADGAPDTPIEKPAVEVLQDFIRALPPRVEFGEVAAPGRAPALDTQDAGAIARAAQDFAEAESKAGRQVSIADAVQHVTSQAGGAGA